MMIIIKTFTTITTTINTYFKILLTYFMVLNCILLYKIYFSLISINNFIFLIIAAGLYFSISINIILHLNLLCFPGCDNIVIFKTFITCFISLLIYSLVILYSPSRSIMAVVEIVTNYF